MKNKEMLDEIRGEIRNFLLSFSDDWESGDWEGFCMVLCHHLPSERKWENCEFRSYCRDGFINKILSLETDTCRIAVVRKEGELPKIPILVVPEVGLYSAVKASVQGAYQRAQEDMLNVGYVQAVTNG